MLGGRGSQYAILTIDMEYKRAYLLASLPVKPQRVRIGFLGIDSPGTGSLVEVQAPSLVSPFPTESI